MLGKINTPCSCGNSEKEECIALPFNKYFRIENALNELETLEQKRNALNNLGIKVIDIYDYIERDLPSGAFMYNYDNIPTVLFLAKLDPTDFGLDLPTTFLIFYTGNYKNKDYYIWKRDGTWVGKYTESEAPNSLLKFFNQTVNLANYLSNENPIPLNSLYTFNGYPVIGTSALLNQKNIEGTEEDTYLTYILFKFFLSEDEKPSYLCYNNLGYFINYWVLSSNVPESVKKVFNDTCIINIEPLQNSENVGIKFTKADGQSIEVGIPLVNNDANGLMLSEDKQKLDNLIVNIRDYTTVGMLLPLNGKIYRWGEIPVESLFVNREGGSYKSLIFIISWGDSLDFEKYGKYPYQVCVFSNSGDDSGLYFDNVYTYGTQRDLPQYIKDLFKEDITCETTENIFD